MGDGEQTWEQCKDRRGEGRESMVLSKKVQFVLGAVLASLVISAAVLSVVLTHKNSRAGEMREQGRTTLRRIERSLQSSKQKMTLLVQEAKMVRKRRRRSITKDDLRSLAESANELTRSLQDFAEVLTKSGFLTVVSRMNEDLKLYNRLLVDLEHIGLHVTSYILEKITSVEKLFSKNEKDLQVIDKINGQQVLFANAAILALEAARFKTEIIIAGESENNTRDELSELNNTNHQFDDGVIATNDIIELNTENQSIIPTSSTEGLTEDTTAINTEDTTAINTEDNTAINTEDTTAINTEDTTAINTEDTTAINMSTTENIAGVINATDMGQDESENDTMITMEVETTEVEFVDSTAQATAAATTEELDFEEEMRKMKKDILRRNEEARITEHIVPDINNELYEDIDKNSTQEMSTTDTVGGFLVEHQSDKQRRQQISAEQIENFVNMELSPEGSGDGLLESDYKELVNDNAIEDDHLYEVEGSGSGDDESIDDDYIDLMTMEEYMIIP